jgi:hypothetical protein
MVDDRLFHTLHVFSVTVAQPTLDGGFAEGCILDTIVRPKVLKRCGSRHGDQQQS